MKIEWNRVTWYSKLLAVVVLAFAIWLGFYFKSEFKKIEEIKPVLHVATNTSNWKTYRNEKFGFEFKYPSEWGSVDVQNVTDESGNFMVLFMNHANFSTHFGAYPYDHKSLNEFYLDGHRAFYAGVSGFDGSNLESYEVNIQINEKASIILNAIGNETDIEIDNKGVDNISNEEGKKLVTRKVLDEVLSTFKFTQSVSIDTSDWKTYRNEKYGFEFKYPANLEFNGEVSNKPQAKFIVWVADDKGYKIQFLIGGSVKFSPSKDFGNVNFSGMVWHKTLWNPGTSEENYVFENSNIQVLVSPDYVRLFEQILSTFKFTK